MDNLRSVNVPSAVSPPVMSGGASAVQEENTAAAPQDLITIGEPEKEWTVLFYMDGKDDLDGVARAALRSLKKTGSDENVNLIAQIDTKLEGTHRGLITADKSGEVLTGSEDLGNPDMGDPSTLKEFITWGMKKYPAKHYALVLWDHGAGFRGSIADDETKSLIDNRELANLLKETESSSGHRMDLVNFSGRLMGQAEVAYELKDCARYMVGAEDEPSSFKKYVNRAFGDTLQKRVIKDLKNGIKERGTVTPEELAKLYVFEAGHQPLHNKLSPTQSAFDLSRMDSVLSAADEVAGLLLDEISRNPKAVDYIRKVITNTQKVYMGSRYVEPYVDYRDLGDFAHELSKDRHFSKTPIAEAARKLDSAVESTIVAEQHATWYAGGKYIQGATGMSAYLPKDYGYCTSDDESEAPKRLESNYGYEQMKFAKDSKWDELLKAVSKDDDWQGKLSSKHPVLSRVVETLLSIDGHGIIEKAFKVTKHAITGMSSVIPPALFPFLAPAKGLFLPVAGLAGGLFSVEQGYTKLTTGLSKETKTGKNKSLIADGVIDSVVGLGSMATCAAVMAGAGLYALPLGLLFGGLAAGRTAFQYGFDVFKTARASFMNVEQKLQHLDKPE
ncbi:MAG: clostripain-related cysteine peptidase [Vulcanimicrobiota bacterium]